MRFTRYIDRLLKDQRRTLSQECGASLTETALTIALVAAAALTSTAFLGTSTEKTLTTAANEISCQTAAFQGGGTGGSGGGGGGSIAALSGGGTPGLGMTIVMGCDTKGFHGSEMPGNEGNPGMAGGDGGGGGWGFTD